MSDPALVSPSVPWGYGSRAVSVVRERSRWQAMSPVGPKPASDVDFDQEGRMSKLARIALVLSLALLALAAAGAASGDPPGSSPPRPGAGPDEHSQNTKLLASLP